VRYIYVTSDSIADSVGGIITGPQHLESILLTRPGGTIVGNNLYPVLATILPSIVNKDAGWTATLKLQRKRKAKTEKVGGIIYFTSLTYRFPKERAGGKRYRPGSIRWLVLNMELFGEVADLADAAQALIKLAERRGVKPRFSPGAFGGALLRASPEWKQGRNPAPWFISDIARIHLPGNHYALAAGHNATCIPSAIYFDQKSSHHTIASTISIPHPEFIRARGLVRRVREKVYENWIDDLKVMNEYVGLMCATVECDFIPNSLKHLYPPWAQKPGRRYVWLWTPDLRLMDRRTRLVHISCSYSGHISDPVMTEYSKWCLDVLSEKPNKIVKPAMLAAYGLLAARTGTDIESYSLNCRSPSPRSTKSKLPIIGDITRSTVENTRVPVMQNVIARGIIEAETRARSIEYARQLESDGTHVSQIYADGVIGIGAQLPLFIPDGWRIAGTLSNVRSPFPNSIIADEIVRLPGIPNGRRSIRLEQTSRTPQAS
jgi:hypothetical protein